MVRTQQPPRFSQSSLFHSHNYCGCWYVILSGEQRYLPQLELDSKTTILATTSRTTLTQTFINTDDSLVKETKYTFPLYDGVSVVAFTCTVAGRIIKGVVKEKVEARQDYDAAVERGETAGLFEQLPEASDIFTTKIGNVPPGEKVVIEIVYLGELKNDAETDGARFTTPTVIAPRYGDVLSDSAKTVFGPNAVNKRGINIQVDVVLEDGVAIRGIQSPSHPIAVTMGRTSTMAEDDFNNNYGSATLSLGSTELEQDFVIIILAKGQDSPRALLETHPTIPNQRALMTTLVPKFNLPNISPEIVFVVDRSGSMAGRIEIVIEALKVFLKSLPVSVKFNICSFGSRHSFLFEKSKTYDVISLKEALDHVSTFQSNYGGTEMLEPIVQTVKQRYKDLPLEVMLLTDGEIYNQQELFDFVNTTRKENARFFTLGIGSGASSALVEGIARAGNGFSQFVNDGEKVDKRLVRMLKAALSPHVNDYTIEVKYDKTNTPEDEGFEIIESFNSSMASLVIEKEQIPPKKKISLFNTSHKDDPPNPAAGRYDHLPPIGVPKVLQAPHEIPMLYSHSRTTIYLLLGPDACQASPKSVVLRGTSSEGPLELEIPVQDIGHGETLHQLAAKKAIHEIEQGRGWITAAKDENNKPLESSHQGCWDLIVEREEVRLGVQFQVGGKHCSFVAVQDDGKEDEVTLLKKGEGIMAASTGFGAPRRQMASMTGNMRRSRQKPTTGVFNALSLSPPTPGAPPPPPSSSAIPLGGGGGIFSGAGGDFDGAAIFGSSEPIVRGALKKKKNIASFSTFFAVPGNRKSMDNCDSETLDDRAPLQQRSPVSVNLSPLEMMHKLIENQEFSGAWKNSHSILQLLGISQDIMISQDFPSSKITETDEDEIKATIIAIAWLKAKVNEEQDVFELVETKAKMWLESVTVTNDVDSVVERVKTAISNAV